MTDSKKYYWLKLKEDFFNQKYIKALRKLPDGDSLTIIYLKMQLLTLNSEGKILFEHIMPTCEAEIALALDEDENKVKFTIDALLNMGVVEKLDNKDILLLAMHELIGCEGDSARRMRAHRNRKASLCDATVTACDTAVTKCDIEKEKEIEIDKEKDIEKEIDNNLSTCVDSRPPFDYKKIVNSFNSICVSLPKINKITDVRKQKIRGAFKLLDGTSFDDFFRIVEKSDFLTGRTGKWNGCGFDWILKPTNLTKIIEGNYDNKNANPQQTTYRDYSEDF